MLDFLQVAVKNVKDISVIYPKFTRKSYSDIMTRGGDFYALYDEKNNIWSTDEDHAIELIDRELQSFYEKEKEHLPKYTKVQYLWDCDSGSIDKFHKYVQKQLAKNSFIPLDEKIIFSNMETKKEDYASKTLDYPLEKGSTKSWDTLVGLLYSPEEQRKIEWSIGSIVNGDSKKIQKFVVFYGGPKSGKSTILNIIQKMFKPYSCTFDAQALGSKTNAFALEPFRNNSLVGIQQDGDLSKIEDNTRLNSLVSHEIMIVNEKYEKAYPHKFKTFLFIGTNKPVKITDAKSGLLRRLIDISPTGKTFDFDTYMKLYNDIDFELGAIAYKCKQVYESNKHLYDNYIPISMLASSNDFYNFMLDSYPVFSRDNETSLTSAWELYKVYSEEAKMKYPMSLRNFREELKNYFWNFYERKTLSDGTRVRSYYSDFRKDKFDNNFKDEPVKKIELIKLDKIESYFDTYCADCDAQYATDTGIPKQCWDKVQTKLKNIDTHVLHYVRPPENMIVIDFDLKDEEGNKSLELNLREASKFPPTYSEISKSGNGIHLHYIYNGDVSKLSNIISEGIEIKTFLGKSALRRKLTFCNDKKISKITSGLPQKEEIKKMLDWEGIKNEKQLRTMICRNLNKEYHANTKPSMDYIKALLDDAYNRNISYDVSNLKNDVIAFAARSTHNSKYCLDLIKDMHFTSKNLDSSPDNFIESKEVKEERPIVFFDLEVFPNLLVVVWKMYHGEKIYWYNPSPLDIEQLLKFRLVGFNNRRYDNHILYARLIGWDNKQIHNLSAKIIKNEPGAFFANAYNLSYTDIYDYASKKQSLKKWEIELGIFHDELNFDWNQDAPKEEWKRIGEYCGHDVDAAEAVWDATKGDFAARKILSEIAKGSVNDKTNTLSAKIIFGSNKHPQNQFQYRFMGDISDVIEKKVIGNPEYTKFDSKDRPIFPGYVFEFGKSTYRGETISEGGQVFARPGIYLNVPVLDIQSMHPSSIIADNLFGDIYTKRFEDLVNARIAVKHKQYSVAKKMLDGALVSYIEQLESGKATFTNKDLAGALKIVINSVYGLTAARFENPFRDPKNIDNIVAKRGALFMTNLKYEVEERGYTVIHIKTDSIKIDNADNDIIKFVIDYGKQYGYLFEHESTYERMALVNDSVYIAKYATEEECKKLYGYVPDDNKEEGGKWTATGKQFQEPYVFKSLFSNEPITLKDFYQIRTVDTAMYIDHQDGTDLEFIGKTGEFIPVTENGGILLRLGKDKQGKDKYDSVNGTKGYLWAEPSFIKKIEGEQYIDLTYYEDLKDKAIDAIMKVSEVDYTDDFTFNTFINGTQEEIHNATLPF